MVGLIYVLGKDCDDEIMAVFAILGLFVLCNVLPIPFMSKTVDMKVDRFIPLVAKMVHPD